MKNNEARIFTTLILPYMKTGLKFIGWDGKNPARLQGSNELQRTHPEVTLLMQHFFPVVLSST